MYTRSKINCGTNTRTHYTHTQVHTHVHTHTCTNTRIHTRTHSYTHPVHTPHTHTCTHTHTHTHKCMHVFRVTCLYTQTYIPSSRKFHQGKKFFSYFACKLEWRKINQRKFCWSKWNPLVTVHYGQVYRERYLELSRWGDLLPWLCCSTWQFCHSIIQNYQMLLDHFCHCYHQRNWRSKHGHYTW